MRILEPVGKRRDAGIDRRHEADPGKRNVMSTSTRPETGPAGRAVLVVAAMAAIGAVVYLASRVPDGAGSAARGQVEAAASGLTGSADTGGSAKGDLGPPVGE